MSTEAADLARIILDDSEPDLPNDLYPLNVREARTLARAVIELTAERDAYREENTRHREKIARMAALADQYDAEARLEMREGDVSESINTQATADRIRTALNGENK